MKNKIISNNVLAVHGMNSSIIKLINQSSNKLPKHLSWKQFGNLYFYAPHLRKKLTPWTEKIQNHFAQNDSEACKIIVLAQQQKELKEFIIDEIVYINDILHLHDFKTLLALFSKLDQKNTKLALMWMKDYFRDEKSDTNELINYYTICTSKEEKSKIMKKITKQASLMHHYHLRQIYEKLPNQRIIKIWFKSLDKEQDFETLVAAAIQSKHDDFYKKAKSVDINGNLDDICTRMQKWHNTYKDERLLGLWLHAITVCYKKAKENKTIYKFNEKEKFDIIDHARKAYQATQDMRFFEFAKKNSKYFIQKESLYKLLPDTELLDAMKNTCSDLADAHSALLTTGDMFFLTETKKYISEKWDSEYTIDNIKGVYTALLENSEKYEPHLKDFKKFIEDNLENLWKKSTNPWKNRHMLELLES